MSQANIPNITPNISITRDDALNLLLSSIALEELGIAHILNAEGEKIQYALGTLQGTTGPGPSIPDLLNVNKSVQDMLDTAIKQEMLLESKLKTVSDIMGNTCGGTGVQNTMYHTIAKQDQFVYTNADGLAEYNSSKILSPTEVSYFNLFINGVIQPLITYTIEVGKLTLLSEEPPALHAPITLQFITLYP
ncbi:DUF4183 domain-containing protein [Bacillus sp. CDB3]|uniref:DUF4183 domain-containing protein n=1 Tax=Bacillus sp. CDB3 TaxID=360310 RepID=UPI0009D8B282|nr:DUF4183 domain-containing protein [Bacillus sp. CDB3]OQR53107.1 hypothetical protein CDB3_32005 [Bacillus sp. CDB3]OQR53338.1 hypothetical protein CDB3_30540 [Bacillus sp. CDB3]